MMCIRLHWDSNHTNVLHQTFQQGWTMQAYHHSMEAVRAMSKTRTEPVTLVMNLKGTKHTPTRMSARGRTGEAKAVEHIQRVILIDPGYFMPQLDCDVYEFETIAQAVAFIEDPEPVMQGIPA